MSEQEFESYLGLLGRFLRLNPRQRAEIRRELRAHLDEAVEANLAAGMDRDEAVRQALEDFGDAAELADRFGNIGNKKRWLMKGTAIAAMVAWLGFLGTWGQNQTVSDDGPQLAGAPVALTSENAAEASSPPAMEPRVDRQPPASPQAAKPRSSRQAVDSVELTRLLTESSIPEVSFRGQPFEQVIGYLAQQLGVNHHIMRAQLEANGIELDREITCQLENVTPKAFLRIVMAEVDPDGLADYRVEEGILVIGARGWMSAKPETRCYDVRDLMEARAGATPFLADSKSSDSVREELCNTLKAVVSPQSWRGIARGADGDLSMFGAVLAVHQTSEVHAEIDAFLADLRSTSTADSRPTASR